MGGNRKIKEKYGINSGHIFCSYFHCSLQLIIDVKFCAILDPISINAIDLYDANIYLKIENSCFRLLIFSFGGKGNFHRTIEKQVKNAVTILCTC